MHALRSLSKVAFKQWISAIRECLNSSHASTVAIGRSGHKWANRVPLTTLESFWKTSATMLLKKFLVSIHKHAVLVLWEACQTYELTHKQVGASKCLVT